MILDESFQKFKEDSMAQIIEELRQENKKLKATIEVLKAEIREFQKTDENLFIQV